MVSEVLFSAAAVALVAATGLAVASLLCFDLPRLLLGAYVVGFTEIVVLMLLLSAFDAVTRPAILVGVALLFAASVAGWLLAGAPRPASVPVDRLRALRRVPVLLVLAVVTALALAYDVALIVGTPPTSHDALTYHLFRAAYWSQEGGVGYVAHAYDDRINAHPPNAEIALTFLFEVGHNERLMGFVQLLAAVVLALGVFVLARKLGLARREAALGALLFLTLPIVLLQASTAQNDLVAASFLLAATVFLFGDSRSELGLAALATALAIGTKVPAAYGLPVLGAVALVAPPVTHRMRRLAALLLGATFGSYWYLVNIVHTGRPLGDLTDASTGLVAVLDPEENFFSAFARFDDAVFDLSGARGPNVLLYVLVGAAVAIMGLLRARGGCGRQALVTGALIAMPLVLLPLGYALRTVFEQLGGPDALVDRFLPLRGWGKTVASDTVSWFGPLGFALVVGVGAAVVVLVRRRALPPLALVLVAAPFIWFVLLALSLGYDITQGRFFMYPVALSAALWGLVLRIDRYAVAVVAIASTSAALSLVHFVEKPSGLRLFDDVHRTMWGAKRWEAQAIAQPHNTAALRFLGELPDHARVALALNFNDFGYPAFGPKLERHAELVPFGSTALESKADWLLANPKRAPDIESRCWRVVRTSPEGWVGFRRRTDTCAG